VQKSDCCLSVKWTSPHNLVGSDFSVNYWQTSCVHQLLVFVLCWTSYVPWSCDTYLIPTPFCFPFISPPTHCHMPSHTHQALHFLTMFHEVQNDTYMNMHLIHQQCYKYPQIMHQSSYKSPNLYIYFVCALKFNRQLHFGWDKPFILCILEVKEYRQHCYEVGT